MPEIKTIIEQYKKGQLHRDIDERYAEGFWDLAGELSTMGKDNLQEAIYNALQEVFEEATDHQYDITE